MMTECIEYVEFKLAEGQSEATLLQGAEESNEWLKEQPGFAYRSLAFDDKKQAWVDVVYWKTTADAQKAGDLFMAEPRCQTLMSVIDSDSVSMNHYSIRNEFFIEE